MKGYIYKLYCLDSNIKEIYIGSTTNLKDRIFQHKFSSQENGRKYKVYNFIRDNGGFDNWDYEILHEGIFKTENDMKYEEKHYIKKYNSVLNTYDSILTEEERILKNRERKKKYREKYPERVKEWKKRDYIKNHDRYMQFGKVYREKNKDKIKENHNKKFNCECGGIYSTGNKARHMKSKKHLQISKVVEEHH